MCVSPYLDPTLTGSTRLLSTSDRRSESLFFLLPHLFHLLTSSPSFSELLPRLVHRSRLQVPQIHLRSFFQSLSSWVSSIRNLFLFTSSPRLPSPSGAPIDSSDSSDCSTSTSLVVSSPSHRRKNRASPPKDTSLERATSFVFALLPPLLGLLSSELEVQDLTSLYLLLVSRSTSRILSRECALFLLTDRRRV